MNTDYPQDSQAASCRKDLLIVDDDARLQKLLVACCSEMGFNVSGADDSFEAIKLLQLRHFDVVLTDFRMPGMNGVELATWTRQHHPEIAICLMSSDAAVAEFCATSAPSLDGWIVKPFSMNALEKCLELVIAHQTPILGEIPIPTGD